MKTRTCPECDLRFKSKPRPVIGADPIVKCPRCGHIIQVGLWDLSPDMTLPTAHESRRYSR